MGLKSKIEKMPGYNFLVLPVHFLQALRAGMKYGWPGKKLRVIGVTGTNGKTTTCFMIWKMLNDSGKRCGLLTTVGWSADGNTLHQQIEHMTTERVGVLNERMQSVVDARSEFLVLEVTSHALMQFRTLGVPIEVAVFTNLTPEHLDYHKTFENYRRAKLKLFKKAKSGVVNADDGSAATFVSVFEKKKARCLTYGIENGDLEAENVTLGPEGVEYDCGDLHITTQIPGRFNVYNSLAAVGVGKILGLDDEKIERGIAALKEVEGRMNRVQEGQDFEVIVDYAHTPDALEKVFASLPVSRSTSLKPATASASLNEAKDDLRPRIIAVHGGAGRRDHGTREPRGEILGKNSDVVIITEDDSRDEDPAEIAEMFVQGAKKAGKILNQDLFVELDREKAIRKAIGMAKTGDVVLVLGKGHEKTILRKDGVHEFEDVKVVRKVLKGLS